VRGLRAALLAVTAGMATVFGNRDETGGQQRLGGGQPLQARVEGATDQRGMSRDNAWTGCPANRANRISIQLYPKTAENTGCDKRQLQDNIAVRGNPGQENQLGCRRGAKKIRIVTAAEDAILVGFYLHGPDRTIHSAWLPLHL
jgi:hypothetical protein